MAKSSIWMLIESRLGGQTPFVIDHCMILSPRPMLEKVETGEALFENAPEPVTTDQLPFPINGELAPRFIIGGAV